MGFTEQLEEHAGEAGAECRRRGGLVSENPHAPNKPMPLSPHPPDWDLIQKLAWHNGFTMCATVAAAQKGG